MMMKIAAAAVVVVALFHFIGDVTGLNRIQEQGPELIGKPAGE